MNPRGGRGANALIVTMASLIISVLFGSVIFYFAVKLGVDPTLAFIVSYPLVFVAVFSISFALTSKGLRIRRGR